ncbi:MAG: Crp/Fnr family transcriptional regulator [Novosphingobium sp.]|nr:Crp/Fnr family transcriptional regulator [Novosphingobium sp.]MCP5402358.1 Crp/Fnr family transcriptional regulator [Novosphingobium sp.]
MLKQMMAERGRKVRLAAGEFVFHQGDGDESVYGVERGLLKAFYTQPDGREFIKSIVPAGAFIASLNALVGNGECTFSLAAIEDCELLALPYRELRGAASEDLEIARDLIGLLAELASRKERREYQLLCMSAEERYELFLEESGGNPDWLSQADLAAYLGITPQALSRIKRRRRERKQIRGS